MTKIKLFQLRLFRTIRRQICSIDMIDIETFTNIFRLLNHVDRSILSSTYKCNFLGADNKQ